MKTNPIYIPLAKVLLWSVVCVLLLAVPCCHDWATRVDACKTLGMIGLSVLGFHGYRRMEN